MSVGLTTVGSLGIIPIEWMLLTPKTIYSLQVWRIITAALYFGNFSFPWLMTIGMFVTYLKYNEDYDFKGRMADMVWMCSTLILVLTLAGLYFSFAVTSFSFVMALCWVFCKRHPELQMTLFSFQFNAAMFPWALMGFHLIMGQGLLADIVGIVAGHAFVFLKDILPSTHGRRLLETPLWLQRQFPSAGPRIGTLGAEVHPTDARFRAPQHNAAPLMGGHQWGRGRALGS